MAENAGNKPKTPKTKDEKLDEALEQSFPAGDPPAQTEPVTHVGAKNKKKDEKKQD